VAVETPSILQQGLAHTVLPCDNKLTIRSIPDESFQGAEDLAAVEAAIKSGIDEIASLMRPVFYQDNQHTLFVEPTVTETRIEEWQEWVTRTPRPDPDWWKDIVAIPVNPGRPNFLQKDLRLEIDRGSLIPASPDQDWLLNAVTVLKFDEVLIGTAGQPGLQILVGDTTEGISLAGTSVNVNPGSGLASGSTVFLPGITTLEQSGLIQAVGGLNVVGNAGFNSTLAQNLKQSSQIGFDLSRPGAGLAER